jgi:hypothetical protein
MGDSNFSMVSAECEVRLVRLAQLLPSAAARLSQKRSAEVYWTNVSTIQGTENKYFLKSVCSVGMRAVYTKLGLPPTPHFGLNCNESPVKMRVAGTLLSRQLARDP